MRTMNQLPVPEPGTLTLVLGGARSGKSRLAEVLAARSGAPVIYVATAEAGDAEMQARIAAHRARRPAGWRTVEAPRDVAAALAQVEAPPRSVVLLDCLTLWLSNLMLAEPSPDEVRLLTRATHELEAVLALVEARSWALVVVSNEVGSGIVPAYPLGRLYRDVAGWLNQWLAARAARVWLAVAGYALDVSALGVPIPTEEHDDVA